MWPWSNRRISALERKVNAIEQAIQNYVDQVEANFAALETKVQSVRNRVIGMDQTIQQLQAQLAGETLSAGSTAALGKLVTDSANFVAEVDAISVAPPAPPVVPPAAPAPPLTPTPPAQAPGATTGTPDPGASPAPDQPAPPQA